LDLWMHAGTVQQENRPRFGCITAEFMTTWFGSVLARDGGDQAQRTSVDGTLALILALAVNIEAIHLRLTEVEPLTLICELPCFRWHTPPAGPSIQSFGKLQALEFHGSHTTIQGPLVRMDPCAKNLHIYACPLAGVGVQVDVDPAQLSVLELSNANITSAMMEAVLKDPTMCNLREIKLTMLTSSDESWKSYDSSALSTILMARFPDLQASECTYPERGNWEVGFSRPFDPFKQLIKLRTIRLLFDLLVDDEGSDPFDHYAMLPPSLTHLTLAEIAYVRHNFPEFYNDESEHESCRASWRLIADPAPSIGLETFTLEIYTSKQGREPEVQQPVQPDPGMRQCLRDIASNAAKRKLTYNAIEYEVDYEKRRRQFIPTIAERASAEVEGT
jgi:hypothetical protein